MSKTPVSLITGYLGSGKTTLIRELIGHPQMGETAVIVNEIGEIGIDHAILRQVDERTVLLASGCLCCTLRGDLAEELRDLVNRRDAGEIPHFRRVVVETTGLADPAPIVNTLLADPLVQHQYVLEHVVSTVDAQHGLRGPESIAQVAAADALVLTKVDLDDGAAHEAEVRRLNPLARIHRVVHGAIEPDELLASAPFSREMSDDGRNSDGPELPESHDSHRDETSADSRRETHEKLDHTHGHHDYDVRAVSLALDGQLDWLGFGVWLTMLLHARGQEIARVKGLLDVGGEGPLLVNAVQHVVHPPVHLDAWPSDDRRSRIVLIGRNLDEAELEASLRAFASSPETGSSGSDPTGLSPDATAVARAGTDMG